MMGLEALYRSIRRHRPLNSTEQTNDGPSLARRIVMATHIGALHNTQVESFFLRRVNLRSRRSCLNASRPET